MGIPYGASNLLFSVRSLWRDMVTWGRAYMVSRFAGLSSSDVEFNRLYQIPQEFGNIMQVIFGYDNAQKFVQYISQQIVLIRSMVEAQMAGDVNLANQLIRQLYSLADERASFMTSINPFWDLTDTRNLIYNFLQLTIEEITAFLSGDYQRDIDIYDRLLHHTDNMGDYLTQGIINYITYRQQNTTPVPIV
jgi:hypothetical protein